MDIKKNAVKARFYTDIEEMMYGFGDDWPPLRDNLLDAIAVKYIEDLGNKDGDGDDGDDDMMTTVIVMIMMIVVIGRI